MNREELMELKESFEADRKYHDERCMSTQTEDAIIELIDSELARLSTDVDVQRAIQIHNKYIKKEKSSLSMWEGKTFNFFAQETKDGITTETDLVPQTIQGKKENIEALNLAIEALKQMRPKPDCERAEKQGETCLGYGYSDTDDEPIDACKNCTEYQGHGVE